MYPAVLAFSLLRDFLLIKVVTTQSSLHLISNSLALQWVPLMLVVKEA